MAIAHSAKVTEAEDRKDVRFLAHVRRDGEAFVPHDLDEHLRWRRPTHD
ncbi:MAG: hypothetical protein HYZ50_03355 [Deltaproteobacteria bacterium]|nr:hypothetical protein [Deltaproteobacteria bacterium]